MAHGTGYWYNQIIALKQTLAPLAGGSPTYNLNDNPYLDYLNDIYTGGQVGRWRLTAYIIAVVINTFEQIMDTFQTYIMGLINQNEYGTIPWYAKMCLYFQYNYILQQVPGTYNFFYTDTTSAAAIAARYITQAAALEVTDTIGSIQYSKVVLKIAGGTPGNNTPVANNIAAAFAAYIDQVQPPGINIQIVNENPDIVKVTGLKVYFDGTLDQPTFETAVQNAITLFLSTVQTPFNGDLFLTGYTDPATNTIVVGFTDAIRAVPGCKGVEIDGGLYARPDAGSFTQVLFSYTPDSGYFKFDTVDSTISYQAA